jgi:hypothetical protein
VRAGRGHDGEGDDERVLAAQGGDDGGFVVVVDGGGFDARRDFVRAALARDGGEGVRGVLEQLLDDVAADLAAGLGELVFRRRVLVGRTPTMAMLRMWFW